MKPDLVRRLRAKISRRPTKTGCRLWRGAASESRVTVYGKIQEGARGSRVWRVHRLVLLLATAHVDVPRDPDEPIEQWLRRANRFYRDQGLQAAHQCDNSLCCEVGPLHLIWESQSANIKRQRERERRRREAQSLAVGSADTAQSAVA